MASAEAATQKSKPDFEAYLMERFAEECPTVLDDDMPDRFNDWLVDQQPDDFIRMANEWRATA